MEKRNAKDNELSKLLEGSILPLMAEMIKAMGEHSYRYENYIKDIKDTIGSVETSIANEEESKEDILKEIQSISELTDKLHNKNTHQEEAFNLLTNTIATFGQKVTDLIDTNNRLVAHQKVQVDKMDKVIHAFEENTARLDTLTLTIEGSNIDKQDHPLFRNEEGSSNDLTNEEKEPIHKVLENEIKRLKNDTKG